MFCRQRLNIKQKHFQSYLLCEVWFFSNEKCKNHSRVRNGKEVFHQQLKPKLIEGLFQLYSLREQDVIFQMYVQM